MKKKNDSYKIVIYSVAAIVIMMITCIILLVIQMLEEEKEYAKEEETDNVKQAENMKTITYAINKEFKKSESTYSTSFDYYKEGNSCNIYIRVEYNTNKYTDGKKFLLENTYVTLTNEYSEIEEKTINNKTWYSISISDDYDTKYYYTYVNKDRTYYIEYSINVDNEDKFCLEEKDRFINSLNVKE